MTVTAVKSDPHISSDYWILILVPNTVLVWVLYSIKVRIFNYLWVKLICNWPNAESELFSACNIKLVPESRNLTISIQSLPRMCDPGSHGGGADFINNSSMFAYQSLWSIMDYHDCSQYKNHFNCLQFLNLMFPNDSTQAIHTMHS